tara:strand:+ start:6598 stop:6990 length:393 start_codon:yes stop_codon:yes gene_type:complete
MEYKFKDKYKTISEVVKLLNMNTQKKSNNHTHTLRYWEKEFKQVKPIKINKRRYYDQKNIDILLKIQYLLKNQGMTIKGVKKFLNNNILDIDENEKKIINSLNIKFRLNKINNLLKNFKKIKWQKKLILK